MWNLNQRAGAVAGFRIAAAGATMREIDEDLNSLLDDLVSLLAANAGDKADPAGVVFVRGIIKTLRWWQTVICFPELQKLLQGQTYLHKASFVVRRWLEPPQKDWPD